MALTIAARSFSNGAMLGSGKVNLLFVNIASFDNLFQIIARTSASAATATQPKSEERIKKFMIYRYVSFAHLKFNLMKFIISRTPKSPTSNRSCKPTMLT